MIANPSFALILMMIGIYGLIFEFSSPGFGVPGTVGAICLLLALFALQLLPVNHAGLALVLLGLALLAAEVLSPTFGVFGVGGIIAFIAGGLLLFDRDIPGFGVPLPLLFGLAEPIRRRLARGPGGGGHWTSAPVRMLLFAPVAVYGGYFGAGMSVMILALFSVSLPGVFRAHNVLKNLLSGLTSGIALVVFVTQGVGAWPPTITMMMVVLVGGFLGGRLARVLPPPWMRAIVLTVGTVLTLVYARRAWGP